MDPPTSAPVPTPAAVATSRTTPWRPPASLKQRLLWLLGGRLLVATVLLVGVFIAGMVSEGPNLQRLAYPFLLIGGITFAVSAMAGIWLRSNWALQGNAEAQVIADLLVSAYVVYASGGLTSAFAFLFGIATLNAAILLGSQAALRTYAAGIALYFGLGSALHLGLLDPAFLPLVHQSPATQARFAIALVSHTLSLSLVALLSAYLAGRLHTAGGELERAQASAANLARLNDDIVRCLSAGLITTDLSANIVSANPAALHLLQSPDLAWLQHQKVDDFLPATGEQTLHSLAPGLTRSPVHRYEGRATRRDGSQFPVGVTRTELRDSTAQVIGTLLTFQDLSEITTLRRAAERAERLSTLGRLAAGLAHEIRNPLGSISGAVELVMASAPLGAEDRHLLDIVVREVERLNNLVGDMLALSRPKQPHFTPVDLRQLSEEVLAMARQDPHAEGLMLELTAARDLPQIDADPGQLRQVVWNLMKNALQVSSAPGRIHLTLAQQSAETLALTVHDCGPGVDPGRISRIFDMFYSERDHGVGIGLALVQQIVRSHHGHIEVHNPPEGGACFCVTLPLHPDQTAALGA
ncbi:MAG: two-component system sensor histidine kinase NtrB [Polyangiales bacterium]